LAAATSQTVGENQDDGADRKQQPEAAPAEWRLP
jgi:hypothetical protein